MRKVVRIHEAVYEPIADLVTYRALPTRSVQYLDPFLFLNHHGPQLYSENNSGLPFGPHPHRGFETVTFVLEGDIAHSDSGGNSGVIYPGGIQWMTAGSGLIHSEVSSEAFKSAGGKLEILQLWINLPAWLKMTQPAYQDLQKEQIPCYSAEDGSYNIRVFSGEWKGVKGPHDPLYDISLYLFEMKQSSKIDFHVKPEETVFCYIIRGSVIVNGESAPAFHLVELDYSGPDMALEATTDSLVLFGHALPFGEPIVAQGPFVMNTQEEIQQAYRDFQEGKFGFHR